MSELQEQYQVDTQQIAPPPPQETPVKPTEKPTLASMIVGQMEWLATSVGTLDENLNGLYVKFSQALTLARTLAIVAIVVASVSAMECVVLMVMVAFLLGHIH